MRHIFQIMEDRYNTPYVYRDASTKPEFMNYIQKWLNIDEDPKDKLILDYLRI